MDPKSHLVTPSAAQRAAALGDARRAARIKTNEADLERTRLETIRCAAAVKEMVRIAAPRAVTEEMRRLCEAVGMLVDSVDGYAKAVGQLEADRALERLTRGDR